MSGTSRSVETVNSPQQLCSRCITTNESALGVGGEIAFYIPAESGERVPINRRDQVQTRRWGSRIGACINANAYVPGLGNARESDDRRPRSSTGEQLTLYWYATRDRKR